MRRLWNRPADAVWSLVTQNSNQQSNMNICTYVTAISLEPKLMTVAVYAGTQTRDNLKLGGQVLLQLLTEELAPVVRVCGQMSGAKVDKVARLKKRYVLGTHAGLPYLQRAAGFMELIVEQIIETSGDHTLVVGKVVIAKNLADAPILTTTYLREKGYIR